MRKYKGKGIWEDNCTNCGAKYWVSGSGVTRRKYCPDCRQFKIRTGRLPTKEDEL